MGGSVRVGRGGGGVVREGRLDCWWGLREETLREYISHSLV